jgi:hypothetical protein
MKGLMTPMMEEEEYCGASPPEAKKKKGDQPSHYLEVQDFKPARTPTS